MEKLTTPQLKIIKDAAKQNGIEDYEIELSSGSQKGDNYLGVITIVNIKDKNSEKVVSTILKTSNQLALFKDKTDDSSLVFRREVLMYKEVLPLLDQYQEEAHISNPFKGKAEYYGSILDIHDESILLENLKSKGYQMWDRKVPMNHEHVALVFTEYAKFHATSMALQAKQPEVYEDLKPKLKDFMFNNDAQSGSASLLLKMADNLKDYPKLMEVFKKYLQEKRPVFESLANETVTITHGDAWCNNMLFTFKNGELSQPINVCFVDWQLSVVGSPIWDLTYFFTVNASKEVLHNYPKYLEIYHKTLSENLKEFGLDPEEIYSFERLQIDWKKYAKCGLIMMIMVGKLMLIDPEEVPDFHSMVNNTGEKSFDQLVPFEEEKQKKYVKRLVDVLQYFVEEGLID